MAYGESGGMHKPINMKILVSGKAWQTFVIDKSHKTIVNCWRSVGISQGETADASEDTISVMGELAMLLVRFFGSTCKGTRERCTKAVAV